MPEARDDQLAAAAGLAGQVPGAGDVRSCLQAYYRHVADDDVTAAGPERLAAVFARHAQLAAHRPQGRALVDIQAGGDAVLRPPADVVDVVTDDMPFLVDSITMELANHGVSARVIVHPQLRVRRDLAGALREIVGAVSGPAAEAGAVDGIGSEYGHDEMAESWTHIEIPPLAAGEAQALAADLERVLGDVRVAVEDYPRMRA
jgi:glutamate dehydrogenase